MSSDEEPEIVQTRQPSADIVRETESTKGSKDYTNGEPPHIDDHDDHDVDGEVLFTLEKVRSRAHLVSELNSIFPDFRVYLSEKEIPVNWSLRKRLGHTIAYGLTTFTAQFGASMMSPNVEAVAQEFHVGREVTLLVFGIYVLGNMVGPIIFAPLSEVSGRKIGVFIPCFIAGVWLCVAANASNVWALMVFRFIAGVFAAAPIVSSGGALGDLWPAESRAAALVLYASCIVMGSTTAPVFGALLDITGSYGWRWTCWLSGLLQMVIPAINYLLLSESYGPVLEKNKARDLRIRTKIWEFHADIDGWKLTAQEFVRFHCMRPILMFLTPVLCLLIIYTSFIYGLLFLCVTSVGQQFQEKHNFSFVASYVPLISISIGFYFGGALNIVNSNRYSKIKKKYGTVAPEQRLPAMMFFGWTLPCGLFIYGWTMRPSIHWFVPCIGLGFVGSGVATIFQGSLVYIVDYNVKYGASGIAANTVLRSVFGGSFPLFSLQLMSNLGVGWGSSLLAFIGLALWPCSWLFYFFGERLRQYEPYGDVLH